MVLITNAFVEAALSLARICLAQNADVALRQSAGINLKKYVREHWSAAFETFQGNPPSHEVGHTYLFDMLLLLTLPASRVPCLLSRVSVFFVYAGNRVHDMA